MREEVERVVALGQMPSEADLNAPWVTWQRAIEGLVAPATDEEAAAILRALPSEGSGFGLAWPLLHFVETAPGWPLSKLLDDSSEFLQLLRERADRARQ